MLLFGLFKSIIRKEQGTMKKKLLGILILPTLVMAGITGKGGNETKSFEKKIYAVEAHRNTALNVMYGVETSVGKTLKKRDPLKETGEVNNYSALETMYKNETGSVNYASGRKPLKTDTAKINNPLALELMYSRIS